MKKKTKRLLMIKEIISNEKISSQDELLHILRERGFEYTQATLSRDLKFLKITKILTWGLLKPYRGMQIVLP